MNDLNKRNNYVDSQFVDVDDFKTEQSFFLEKIRQITDNVAANGVFTVQGLEVQADTTMAEPVAPADVAVAIDPSPDVTAPNPQNFTVVPDVLDSLAENFSLYTVFKTNTQNLQRLDLRITLDQAATGENLDLILRIKQLVDGTNASSPLANTPPLVEIQLAQGDIPALDSDDYLLVDLSNENSGQGVPVVKGIYYAIELEYRRPVASFSSLRLFHSPLDKIATYDPDIISFIYTNGRYSRTFSNTNGVQQQFVLYHRVYTSALRIEAGEAVVDGNRTIVEPDQFRFLEIPDRRNVDVNGLPVQNFIVLRYAEEFTDPETIESTKQLANTRIKDSSTVTVMTQPQWDALIADTTQRNTFLLLATVSDSNITSIFQKEQFTVPANSTNLAFQDWLNPSNDIPTAEAASLQLARPADFIFFVSNVPGQVPLTDSFGNVQLEPATIRDEFGNILKRAGDPVLDDIVRVVVNISLDNGKNTRSLELAQVSEIGTSTTFANYAATLSNLFDNPFDNVFSFNFNTDQLAPNVTYNFVAFTKRGLPIFIQDYNRVVGEVTVSGQVSSLREQQFSVFLDRNSRTAVIEQDLQLGAFNPASDQSQPGVVQFVPTLITSEVLTPVGNGQQEDVTFSDEFILDPTNSFLFPAPMVRADGLTKIINTDDSVSAASDIGDIVILVDAYDGAGPIDITFSGLTDRDKGGNGSVVLIQGIIDANLVLPTTTEAVLKVRNEDGRDNTNASSAFNPFGPALVGGTGNIRAFSIIARGFDSIPSPTNVAGFAETESVYLYINDQQALDQNFQPITFAFDTGTSVVTVPTIFHLGPQKYFREKTLRSIQGATTATPGVVLIDTGLDINEELSNTAQVIFNPREIPTAIDPNTILSIVYNSVITTPQDISFYKTQFNPIGTRTGLKIENTQAVSSPDEFISVPDAIALTSGVTNSTALDPATFQSVAFFIDGINITSLLSPIGQKTIVADNAVTLQPGQIAFNPEEGTIVFYTNGVTSEAPSDFTRLSASYFKLDTRFVFNTATNAFYEPRFDINNDGRIDELDLITVTRALGSSIGDLNYLAAADFNNDGKVDDTDLALFQEHFGAVSLGEPDYSDATSARLEALLVAKEDNFLTTLRVIRAVSRAPDATAPNGRTVLFFDNSTPVLESGNYAILFGFSAALSLGFIQAEVETVRPLNGILNLNNIQMFETGNPTNIREIIQIEASEVPNTLGRFNSVLTFSPAINETSEFTIRALWAGTGIAVRNAKDLIIPQAYEQLDRKIYGPFKTQYKNSDFDLDGTSIGFTLKATDATNADGSPDLTGTHIHGVQLSELTFTAHLTIPNVDGTNSIWTWHNLQPSGIDNELKLEFNDNLFIDHRIQGKDRAEVLTPFGLGVDQVTLKPIFAGGDLQNDLANISIIRSDVVSKYVSKHQHTSDRDGGILTSRTVQFADDLARLNIEEGDMTDAIYRLLDIIAEQEQAIELIRSAEGIVRWDKGLTWDDPDSFWDS